MKTLVKTLLALLLVSNLNAQTASPEPPQPPTTPSTQTSSYSSSISVSQTDEDYKIKAKFNKARFNDVKDYLVKQLGKDGLKVNGNTYSWSHGSDAFECKLTKTSLRLHMDFDATSKTYADHVKSIGKTIKYVISGGDPEDEITKAQEELEEAQRDLERARAKLRDAKKN